MLFEPPELIVVSKRAGSPPTPEGYTEILIDRTTSLGNTCFESTRTKSIASHKKWLDKKMTGHNVVRTQMRHIAQRIVNGEKIALVCWCKPKSCHGDNYVKVIKALVKQIRKKRCHS